MSNVIVWLIVGLIAGFLASRVIRGRGLGVPMDIVVGLVGALLGGFLAGQAGIAFGGFLGEVVVAFVGAVILLLVARMLSSRGRLSRR